MNIYKTNFFYSLTKNIVSKENSFVVIVLLFLYPLLINIIILTSLYTFLYFFDKIPSSGNAKLLTFKAADYYAKIEIIFTSVVLTPLIETLIFFMIIIEFTRKLTISKVWIVHTIGILFSLAHIFTHNFIIQHYVTGVIWAWAWILWEEDKNRRLHPFFLIFWPHLLNNGFIYLFTFCFL
ncbi:MAG TPA: hypothetical protein PLO56_07315 [Rhodothermales bacterium]|nr:hypothetical protein [Rhodothermales bacterium]